MSKEKKEKISIREMRGRGGRRNYNDVPTRHHRMRDKVVQTRKRSNQRTRPRKYQENNHNAWRSRRASPRHVTSRRDKRRRNGKRHHHHHHRGTNCGTFKGPEIILPRDLQKLADKNPNDWYVRAYIHSALGLDPPPKPAMQHVRDFFFG